MTAQAADPVGARRPTSGHVPGEAGVWILVIGDMCVFAALFTVFLLGRADAPELYAGSRDEVNQTLGAVNMLVLLTSSLCVVHGVRAYRQQRPALADRLLSAAAAGGVLFLAIKAIEYAQKLDGGIDPGTNDFYRYFFIVTGIHAVHVVFGVGVLLLMRHVVRRPTAEPNALRTLESGASFWHMVDLLWVVLYPLLYLAS